jgi:hypothetical protein
MAFLYTGFEFFVLQALRSYYPRHRRLFNILNLLLWGVPNDAEYALEVVRLSRNSQKGNEGSSSTATEDSTKLRQRKAIDDMDPLKPLPPTSDIVTNLTQIAMMGHKPGNAKPTFQEQAGSAASTLALLAAAAAVNKVKKTVDNHKDKKKKATEEVSTDNDSDGMIQILYVTAFMY